MQGKRTLIWALWISALMELTQSICSGAQYWNPLNNACVDSNCSLMQSAPGATPRSTTRTPPLTCASQSVPPPPVSTPMTGSKPASIVTLHPFSMCVELLLSNILRRRVPQVHAGVPIQPLQIQKLQYHSAHVPSVLRGRLLCPRHQ